jgi:hypothetical protein
MWNIQEMAISPIFMKFKRLGNKKLHIQSHHPKKEYCPPSGQ